MFHTLNPAQTQAANDAATQRDTLRAMLDFTRVYAPDSPHLIARRPFTIHTREGARQTVWSGAFLSDTSGAIAVQADLNHDVVSTNTRAGRDLSWALRQTGIYAREPGSISEFESRLSDLQTREAPFSYLQRQYNIAHVLELLRALGAPDGRFALGHFTWPGAICDLEEPQLLALSGTVARIEWRAFLLPVVPLLQFANGGHI